MQEKWQVGHSDEVSSPDFAGLDTLSTWRPALAQDADSVGWVDDTHGPRLSFPTVLIALRVTRHYLRHLGKKDMIKHPSLDKNADTDLRNWIGSMHFRAQALTWAFVDVRAGSARRREGTQKVFINDYFELLGPLSGIPWVSGLRVYL